MGGAACSGVGMASNQITRKAPKPPEVGQVQPTPDHPTRSQGESEESSKKPEGGGKSAGGASPLEPATTDQKLGPPKAKPSLKPKAKPRRPARKKVARQS